MTDQHLELLARETLNLIAFLDEGHAQSPRFIDEQARSLAWLIRSMRDEGVLEQGKRVPWTTRPAPHESPNYGLVDRRVHPLLVELNERLRRENEPEPLRTMRVLLEAQEERLKGRRFGDK